MKIVRALLLARNVRKDSLLTVPDAVTELLVITRILVLIVRKAVEGYGRLQKEDPFCVNMVRTNPKSYNNIV